MIDFIFSSTIGILFGIIVGLLPGFGLTTCMMLLFPFLINQSLIFCIVFYCTICTVSPYFGNITTLTLKIPGETTSLPLIEIMKNYSKDINSNLFFLCSIGSFFAFFVSTCLIFIFFIFFEKFSIYLKTYVSFIFCFLGIILSIFVNKNSKLFSVFIFVFGWLLAKIGYDSIERQNFLTFDNIYLHGGIPTFPVIVGIFGIPSLFSIFLYLKNTHTITLSLDKEESKILLFFSTYKTILVSTFIGFFSGLIPYMGNSLSSYYSYIIDKKINGNNFYKNCVSVETANNSANVSVLIPLLFWGIAISPSEFILLEILPLANVGLSLTQIKLNFHTIFMFLTISNIICFFISWKIISPLIKILLKLKYFFPIIIFLMLIGSVFYVGSQFEQAYYYVIVLFFSSIFGIIYKDKDLLPLIYAFMLQNNFEQIIYRTVKLYF